jgi:hypothetical protein
MTFHTDEKVMTEGETTLEAEEAEEVIAPKITFNRIVIFSCDGVVLGLEEVVFICDNPIEKEKL